MACKFFKRGQQAQCSAAEHVVPSLLEQAVFCFNEFARCPYYLHFQSAPYIKKEMQNAMELKGNNAAYIHTQAKES